MRRARHPKKSAPLPSETVLDRLKDLHPRLIDLSLDRIARLLAALGHPEDALPPVVHVAGTNGKGSLLAMLKAIAEAAGLSVHLYTSPHLVRFNERIVVRGGAIADDALTAILEECEASNGGRPITYFEITTAAAFLAFARAPADLALIETGLGGRFDATNVIDRPALCAITPVSRDHVQFLGADIASIAFEKAGILKPGVPCIVGPQQAPALAVIAERAGEIDAPLSVWRRDWHGEAAGDGMTYRDGAGRLALPLPALAGPHQIVNAAAAIACARRLGDFDIGEAAIAEGLRRATWPARLQRLTGALAAAAGPDAELWLDGGHNAAAGEALAQFAAGRSDRPLWLVFGALNSRDPADFLRPLAPFAAGLRAVAIAGEENSLGAAEAAEAASGLGIDAAPAAGLAEAVDGIARTAPRAWVLICGSLYLAGEALRLDGAEAG